MPTWLSTRFRNGPTREGWYYLVVCGFILGGAIVRDINLLLLFAGLMLGPLIFNGYLAGRTLRRIRARRRAPAVMIAGDSVTVEMQLTGRQLAGTRWFSVQDELQRFDPDGRPVDPPIATAVVPVLVNGGVGRANYVGRLHRRGRYRFRPVRVSTCDPWGLARRVKSLGNHEELLVYPRLGQLTDAWRRQQRETWRGGQHTQLRQGQGGEFYGLRDWRPGDSRRTIHWRSTARHGSLMVRQFEQPRTEDLVFLLDLWQPTKPAEAALASVERAVRFSATLLHELCRQGHCRVVFGIRGRQIHLVHGAASQRLYQEAMDLLTVAEADPRDNLAEVRGQAWNLASSAAGTLLVTTRHASPAEPATHRTLHRLRVGSPEFNQLFVD